jgi:hypothetical protein
MPERQREDEGLHLTPRASESEPPDIGCGVQPICQGNQRKNTNNAMAAAPHSPRDGGLWAHMGWLLTGHTMHNDSADLFTLRS